MALDDILCFYLCRRYEKYPPALRASPKGIVEVPAENREGTKFVELRPIVQIRYRQLLGTNLIVKVPEQVRLGRTSLAGSTLYYSVQGVRLKILR